MYRKLIEDVAKFVSAKGADVDLRFNKPIPEEQLKTLASSSAIPIPEPLIELYGDVGNGLWFLWKKDKAFGKVELDEFSDLVIPSLDSLSWMIEWDDTYDYRYTDNPSLAKKTAHKMRHWLRFHEEGNGDCFAIDTQSPSCPVVFNKHDWMDGGTGFNGWELGATFEEFFKTWADVSFQCPKSLWWPSVFNEDQSVDWASNQFYPEFRRNT